MRYILILLALTLGLQGFGQWSRPNQNFGSRAYRWGVDSTLYFPTGCGTPSGVTGLRLGTGANLNQGAIYFDSCASKVWFYDPKLQTWIAGSGGGGGTVYMDTVYTRNDSLFGFKYGVEFWTGGLVGGKNFANADLTATGDRYHNFKGYGLTIDSVSAVFIGQESDTASAQVNMEGTGFISDKYRTIPSVSGGGLTEFSNATSGLVSMSTTVSGVGYGFPFSANSIKLKSSMPFEPSYSKNGVFVSADSIFLNNDNDESQAYAPRTSDTTNYLPLLMDRTTGALVPCLTCDFGGGGGTGRLNSITANFPLKIDSTDPINPIVYPDTLGGATALSNRGHSQYLVDSLAALKVPKTTTVAGFPLSGNVTLASLTPGYGMTGSAYDGSVARTFVTDSTLFSTKAFSNNSYLPVGSAWLTNASNTGGAIRFGLASNNSIRFVNNSTEKMVIDSLGNVGIGTSAPTARVHSLSTTEQFRLGFDVSNYMSATVSGTGATTLNTTGSSEQFIFSDRITSNVAAGAVAFSSNGTSANSNFLVYGSSVGASTSSELLYGGATTTYNRAFMRGGTNAAIPTSGGASTLTIGTNDYTKAASGIHGLFSQAVIKPLTISGSGATVTNAAGIYIEDGPTGATNNYPIWVAGTNGSVRFDVPLVVGGTTPSASAIGEFVSTTKGVLLPRMTGSQQNAITSPASGLLISNSDSGYAPTYYTGSAWRRVGSASAAGSTGQIQYNNSNFFAASSNFTFDPAGGTSGALTVNGKILLGDTLRGLVAGTNTPYLVFGASGLRLQGLANSFITMASNAVGVTGALTSNTSFTALTNATFNTTANVGATVQHGIYRAAGSFSSGSASAGQSSFYKFYGTVSGGTIPKTMWLHDSAIVNGINITDYSSAVLNPNVTGNYTGIRIAPTGVTGLNIALAAESGSSIFGGATPNASAVVEARSTTKGFLPPVMTTVQKNAIVSPAIGLIVFDTTLMKLCVYTTVWETITSL